MPTIGMRSDDDARAVVYSRNGASSGELQGRRQTMESDSNRRFETVTYDEVATGVCDESDDAIIVDGREGMIIV